MKPLKNKIVYNTSHLLYIKSAFRIIERRDFLGVKGRFKKDGIWPLRTIKLEQWERWAFICGAYHEQRHRGRNNSNGHSESYIYVPIMSLAPCQAGLYSHCIWSSQQSWDYEVDILQIREFRSREVLNVRIPIQCLGSSGRWEQVQRIPVWTIEGNKIDRWLELDYGDTGYWTRVLLSNRRLL